MSEAAQKEAVRRYAPLSWIASPPLLATAARDAFVAGAEWQAAQPVTVTAERVREAASWYSGLDPALVGPAEVTRMTRALTSLGIEVTP